MIKLNSNGSEVKYWQSFLIQQGLLHDVADGIFGHNTQAATIAFQTAHGLTPDGVVGPATIAKASALGYQDITTDDVGFSPSGTSDVVFDISHHNTANHGPLDFQQAKAAGKLAVFHKLTDGLSTHIDSTYNSNKQAAKAAGFLWGTYHFGEDRDGTAQANNLLGHLDMNGETLIVLDFERNSITGKAMTVAQAAAFVRQIYAQTGKYPGLYGGSYLKDHMSTPNADVLSNCWLWLAEYGTVARLPSGWDQWTFWQYTDGTIGPNATPISGIGHCDKDLFNGDTISLRTFWSANGV